MTFQIKIKLESDLRNVATFVYINGLTCINNIRKYILYVQEVVTQPKILNQTILSNLIHVTVKVRCKPNFLMQIY